MVNKKKILLIDDEEDFCFFVRNNLEQTGEFQVLTATNGEKGIELAKEKGPDLILLDILMPRMPGSDVAENLLLDPRTKQIPVVFLTAIVTQKEIGVESIKEIGGQDFIAKPVDTDRLISCVKKVLERETQQ